MVHVPRARAIGRALLTALAVTAIGVSPASATADASPAAAGTTGCTVTSVGPVLYHTIVFPVIEARCDSVQRRIRVSVVMTADGVAASQASRDCRNASVCHLDIDAWTFDRPGNQLWCATGAASSQNRPIGGASSCEANDF